MKLRLLLSILFVITTTLSAVHEVEHIEHSDDLPCLVCHVNDNLSSADVVDELKDIEIFHFENIVQNNQVSSLHIKNRSNQNRAPPKLS